MKRGVCCVVVAYLFLCSASAFAGDVKACARVIKHVRSVVKQGDLPIAKLLVDSAVDNDVHIGCSEKQQATLLELRVEIYVACINELLQGAKKELLDKKDGHAALRNIYSAVGAANGIGIELTGIDDLWALAFFRAAKQSIVAATEAEQSGNAEEGARLRLEAAEFKEWANLFDAQIKREKRRAGP